jgi:CMP-N,N'-diacetyllegionaminic acid synthase
MINNKSVIAIIPARGGSKGLPGKNIRDLCGKPLIAWTIEKALKSQYLDAVVVTTDAQEIADIAILHGAEAPFLRPPELASDTATTLQAVEHLLGYYRDVKGQAFDYVVLLEPTSPLREDNDIDRALATLHENAADFDGIITLGEVNEHPSIIKRLDGPRISPFCPDLVQTTRRQDNIPAYFPFGVAYIVKTDALLGEQTFYVDRTMGFPIQRYQAYEIDDIYDFLCVESIMRYKWGVK